MRRITSILALTALLALGARVVAGQSDKFARVHQACATDAAENKYTIAIDPATGTTMTMAAPDGTATTVTFAGAIGSPSAPWHEGVGFANSMRGRGVFPLVSGVNSASWTNDAARRVDAMVFAAADGSNVTFASTTCDGWYNCQPWGQPTGGPHCWSAYETCCGWGTMFPQCIDKSSGDQCCTWFKGATACNSTQSCCGMMGPGASSSAFCCNEGSSCCLASSFGVSTCCATGTSCCALGSYSICCGADEFCDKANWRCSKTSTAAP